METNVNYTVVGAFVITLVAAVTLAIIWLSSGFSFEQYTTYMVYMQESVAGLNVDAPVEYNGVNVGSVESIELNHKNPQLVELLLKIKSTTPITRGTVATLNTRGVTGITYIALKDKSDDLTPLKAVHGQPYPVIRTAPSIFVRLDTALSQLTTNLQVITKSIQSVLDKENQEHIKETLANLDRITGTLASNSQKLDAILMNTAKASQQFTPLVQSSASIVKILETQTLPATYHMLNNLDSVTRSLAEMSAEIKQNPAMLIRGVDRRNQAGPGEN